MVKNRRFRPRLVGAPLVEVPGRCERHAVDVVPFCAAAVWAGCWSTEARVSFGVCYCN